MKNYGPGEPIQTIEAFDLALEQGHLLYIKNWEKTAHPIILANMNYRTLKSFIKHGQVTFARRLNLPSERKTIEKDIAGILDLKKWECAVVAIEDAKIN